MGCHDAARSQILNDRRAPAGGAAGLLRPSRPHANAVTGATPKRKAMDKDEALTVIKNEAGIKWDPVVVNALFEVING